MVEAVDDAFADRGGDSGAGGMALADGVGHFGQAFQLGSESGGEALAVNMSGGYLFLVEEYLVVLNAFDDRLFNAEVSAGYAVEPGEDSFGVPASG